MHSPIKVGMTASLSGRYALQGAQALAGVRAWVSDINRLGGVTVDEDGQISEIEAVYYDDESQNSKCTELTKRLIVDDRVDILMGPYSSGLSLRAARVAELYGRVLWNHGGSSESIFASGFHWTVGVLSSTSGYFDGVIELCSSRDPMARRVAIVNSTAGAFPKEVAGGAIEKCRQMGLDEVVVHEYVSGTEDFSNALGSIESLRPDLVLSVGRIEDDVRFSKQYIDSNVWAGLVGLIATPLGLFRDALGEDASQFVGPSQWEPDLIRIPDFGPNESDVIASLSRSTDLPIDYPMAQAYASCLIAQKCIEDARSLEPEKLRAAASELDITTFYGRFRIDSNTGRQLGHVMPVVRWLHDTKEIVWPIADRTD